MWKPLWVQKEFDRYADQAARPVRGRHLIGLAAFGSLVVPFIAERSGFAVIVFFVLLWLDIALRNRQETLEYFRARGIDPYNKTQVREDEARLQRKLQDEGIITRDQPREQRPLPRLGPDEQPWLITRIADRLASGLNRFFAAIGNLLLLGTVLMVLFSEDARAVAVYLVWHAAQLIIAGTSATLAE